MQDDLETLKSVLDKAQKALEASAVMLNTSVEVVKKQQSEIAALTMENLNLREQIAEKSLRN